MPTFSEINIVQFIAMLFIPNSIYIEKKPAIIDWKEHVDTIVPFDNPSRLEGNPFEEV